MVIGARTGLHEITPMTKPAAPSQDTGRRDRLGAALRENLKRRKQQARARAAREEPSDDDTEAAPPARE